MYFEQIFKEAAIILNRQPIDRQTLVNSTLPQATCSWPYMKLTLPSSRYFRSISAIWTDLQSVSKKIAQCV